MRKLLLLNLKLTELAKKPRLPTRKLMTNNQLSLTLKLLLRKLKLPKKLLRKKQKLRQLIQRLKKMHLLSQQRPRLNQSKLSQQRLSQLLPLNQQKQNQQRPKNLKPNQLLKLMTRPKKPNQRTMKKHPPQMIKNLRKKLLLKNH